LWPASLALARALPARLDGVRVVELGCGLALPSLVAAARGARVTAIDWAADAIALLRTNAAANGLLVDGQVQDWRRFDGDFDLALAADVLYEERNVEPLARLLPRRAPGARTRLCSSARSQASRWRTASSGSSRARVGSCRRRSSCASRTRTASASPPRSASTSRRAR